MYTAAWQLRPAGLEVAFDGNLPPALPYAVFATLVAYSGAMALWVSRRRTASPLWARILMVAVETSVPTLLVLILAGVMDPAFAVVAPPTFLYFVFIALACLHLDANVVRIAGGVSAVGYLIAVGSVLSRASGELADSFLLAPLHHVVKAAILLAFGLILAEGVRFLRSVLRRALTEARQHEVDKMAALSEADVAYGASEAKSAFLADMTHELRTPLAAIVGSGELLERTGLDDAQRRHVEIMLASSEALLALISDVLDFSKIEAGALVLHPGPVQLRERVATAARIVGPRANAKGLELSVDMDRGVPEWVKLDGHRVLQILLNLLSNAVKFTERGSVTVLVAPSGPGRVRLAVEDTGIGIPQARLQVLARPYVQADASVSSRFGGTGLGLAITKRLAELHGGELTIDSEVGAGSVFAVELPAQECEPPSSARATERSVDLSVLRVLLIEDNPVNRTVGVALLHQLGVDVETARDGREAVELVAKARFDILLMDLRMPVMDGIEASRAIRALPLDRQPVIVALTADAQLEARDEALASGMNAYLTKPIRAADLSNVLARWAGRTGEAGSELTRR